jgi:hypothetical protein
VWGFSQASTESEAGSGHAAMKTWKKCVCGVLAALLIVQIYFVRELLAALLIFTIFFVIVASFVAVIYLIGRAGEVGIHAAEPVARRGLVLAEDLSKKTFHRPHSAPVQ